MSLEGGLLEYALPPQAGRLPGAPGGGAPRQPADRQGARSEVGGEQRGAAEPSSGRESGWQVERGQGVCIGSATAELLQALAVYTGQEQPPRVLDNGRAGGG